MFEIDSTPFPASRLVASKLERVALSDAEILEHAYLHASAHTKPPDSEPFYEFTHNDLVKFAHAILSAQADALNTARRVPPDAFMYKLTNSDDCHLSKIDEMPATQKERGWYVVPLYEVSASAVEAQQAVIAMLLAVASAAEKAAEDADNIDSGHIVSNEDYMALCVALDGLDDLPDDKPDYTLGAAAKAEWALRGILENTAQQIEKEQPNQKGGAA